MKLSPSEICWDRTGLRSATEKGGSLRLGEIVDKMRATNFPKRSVWLPWSIPETRGRRPTLAFQHRSALVEIILLAAEWIAGFVTDDVGGYISPVDSAQKSQHAPETGGVRHAGTVD